MQLVDAPSDALDVEQVYRAHGEFLWASLHRLGVRSADVPDALQEVLVVVHKKLDSYRGEGRITTWLFGICLRVAAAQRRRAHVRREELRSDAVDATVPHPGATPEEAALAREGRRQLEEVLDGIEPERRALFVMYELEGFSCAELAELMDVPVGTIHSRLHAARKDFEQSLARVRARSEHRHASSAAERGARRKQVRS